MNWKKVSERPQDDKNYLVAWIHANGEWSTFHRAYFVEEEGYFFSLENNNSHPIHADVYLEIPDVEET